MKTRYDEDPSAAPDHPAVEAFYRELCGRYPTLDDWPEETQDDCPWNMGPDRMGGYVTVCMSDRALEKGVLEFVVDLALRHKLVCYDPQSQTIH